MSEAEYNDYLKLSEQIEIVSTGKENLQIKKTYSIITFVGKGRLVYITL